MIRLKLTQQRLYLEMIPDHKKNLCIQISLSYFLGIPLMVQKVYIETKIQEKEGTFMQNRESMRMLLFSILFPCILRVLKRLIYLVNTPRIIANSKQQESK